METTPPSFLQRLRDRLFPKIPDFFAMLAEQSQMVAHTTGLLADFMESNASTISASIIAEEEQHDERKAKNVFVLNSAFATPIDREDIYRAIVCLDEVVNYCKSTIREMEILGIGPDQFTLEIAMHIKEGAAALAAGFGKLAQDPADASKDAERARKEERRAEKSYRRALAALFQGTDYINMFKRREVYRHLSNAADRISAASYSLQDILVKMG